MALLELSGISKQYGATQAVRDASIACEGSTVHALLGENGAGKSTLVKILSGIVKADSGTIRVDGNPVTLKNAASAANAGIATAYQELSLIPDLTVAENLCYGREPRNRYGLIDRGRMRGIARDLMVGLGMQDIDPDAAVGELDLSIQQKLEIARTIAQRPRICLMDEPTSSLTASDVEWFFAQVEALKRGGGVVIFISHRLDEVRAIADTVSVLRNGSTVGTFPIADVSNADMIQMMIGRVMETAYPAKSATAADGRDEPPLLEVRDLRREPELRSVSLTVRRGEIVGVAGLQGHGQEVLFNSIFGAVESSGGQLVVKGVECSIHSPANAMAIGIGLIPESRKTEGLFLNLSGASNISVASLGRLSRFSWVRRRAETSLVARLLSKLKVDTRAFWEPVDAFSGGNQQKFVIGKWLAAEVPVLLMFDPTRGVDVGTKYEIYLLMRDFVANGGGILLYSSDLDELVHVSDRTMVLYRGEVVSELSGDSLTAGNILPAMLRAEASA